ncbi:MAG: hypothetical protein MJZ64_00320 [Paludibacteraceae bacterium]|nr:hypothetical protein [Paludibacteraceae bacterium]
MENQRCTLPPMHHRDKMCLDKLQRTHGSFITAGSTAYSLIKKIEALFAQFKTWFMGLLETVTEADVHAMWYDDAGQFRLNQSKLNIDKLG